MWQIALCVYLSIGLIIAFFLVKVLDSMIEDKENGECLDSEDERRLDELADMNSKFGGKGTLVLMFVSMAVFWLPFLIFNPPND